MVMLLQGVSFVNMINPDGGRISLSSQMQETRGFQSPPASNREPKEEMIRSLSDENSRLRQELEAMKRKMAEKSPSESGNADDSSFRYNMNTNTLTLNGFQTKDMLIRHLQAKVGNGDRIEKELQSSVGLAGMGGTDSNALAAQIKKAPLDITEFSIQITSQDATKAVIGSKNADLEKEGIKNLNIAFEPGGKMTINGTLKKIIPIPFSLRGDISVTDDNRIRYEVKDINAGFLPLPDLIKTLAMSVASGSFNDKSIEVSGDTFTLNTAAMMPDNIKAKPTRITTGDGFVVVE
jgi:hypothetical protein